MASHDDRSLRNPSGTDSSELKVLPEHGVRRMGYLRKLKTMKKKFFVLREGSEEKPAELEYFDAQKKFDQGHVAKRVILVGGCFAVNRKDDCEQKYTISIFTSKDTFSVVANSEREQGEWLKDLVELQRGALAEGSPVSENAQPLFDYVWNVDIQKKGLGITKGISGPYRLCLANRMLKLYPLATPSTGEAMNFSLARLRKVGHTKKYFFLEVGRHSATGPGEFCLEAEDVYSAQHMHDVISEEMRKGGPSEEGTTSVTSGGQRSRSNTDTRPRQRGENDVTRRFTYETSKDRQTFPPENEMSVRAASDLTPGSNSSTTSRERLTKLTEQRTPEYAIPDFQHSTSVEENYLPVDLDPAYYPCDYPGKGSVEAQPNYSAIAKLSPDSPRTGPSPGPSSGPSPGPAPGPAPLQDTNRTQITSSIAEEGGDYIPVTMPTHPRVTPPTVAIPSGNSSEEFGYFEMNLPPKAPPTTIIPPTTTATTATAATSMVLHERLPPVLEASPSSSSAYMMMIPTALGGSQTLHPSSQTGQTGQTGQTHPLYPSEREEGMGSEVTYAVMEPVVSRNRRENSSREASTSSLGSSFGWDRLSSIGSRAEYKLEKVKAFMALEDEDTRLRENRAYSTGCQPTKPSSTFRPDVLVAPSSAGEAFRIRAYSLGNHSSSPTSGRIGGRQRGIVHSPSATLVMAGLNQQDLNGLNSPNGLNGLNALNSLNGLNQQDVNGLNQQDGSGRSTPSGGEGRRLEGAGGPGGLGGNRAEDLMELTFRPRSGSVKSQPSFG